MPLVVSDKVEEIKKTKEAVQVLKKLKAWSDIEKVFCIAFLLFITYFFCLFFLKPPKQNVPYVTQGDQKACVSTIENLATLSCKVTYFLDHQQF